jgi:hypothetical protein
MFWQRGRQPGEVEDRGTTIAQISRESNRSAQIV